MPDLVVVNKSDSRTTSAPTNVNDYSADKGAEPLLPVNAALAPALKLGCGGDVCVCLWVVCMCAILCLRSTKKSLSTPV